MNFRDFARKSAEVAGNPYTFACALGITVVWLITGPFVGWSDAWQLVINTLSTIVTTLLVMLVQNTQNRDARAIHLKLDELIRSHRPARDRFADLEDATEEELAAFEREFKAFRQDRKGEGEDE